MKKQPLDRSFGYAFEGIWNTVKSERNMQIHLGFTVCVIIAGFIFRISKTEWLFCLVLFGQVMSLELVRPGSSDRRGDGRVEAAGQESQGRCRRRGPCVGNHCGGHRPLNFYPPAL